MLMDRPCQVGAGRGAGGEPMASSFVLSFTPIHLVRVSIQKFARPVRAVMRRHGDSAHTCEGQVHV